jgi:mono/diheme cytochrome c family protein
MMNLIAAAAALAFSSPSVLAAAKEPTLAIHSGSKEVVFKRSELLKRKDAVTLKIDYDPALPGRTIEYRAVPAHALFEGIEIPKDATIQFKCLDGFAGPIDKEKLLNTSSSGAMAYLAIETPESKWPALNPPKDMRTAAPYYLVWVDPKKSGIGQEQWPFQLAGFDVKGKLESLYPAIVPQGKSKAVRAGFDSFVKNCFACHTMNRQGASEMGPDLNVPKNPTEYFTEATLRAYVRDPQSLRHWPQAKMTPFSKDALPDAELSELLAYLRQMSRQKAKK